ncbi:hypothetical protein SAMD00019534_002440 [Acytostelium subglobosum LB1]|uniref:hypothetical protein n=1 Tax=Acytostelium subglobosum LB1 TaxID=1410327 RepID=UPI0006447E5D|nr:hypothetical protein SAMD00019534_002440 [Acytostelium subglobosum LB1]GAM17069.1 hypothetical protein SAMD00019534_002440 [Acytostelium subglobosum LB1]|eukprot:XP_012759131.1 hypothetical protein SAMD00019534_002440 [Acytostelium subglobosum LB1]
MSTKRSAQISFKVVDKVGECSPCIANFRCGPPPLSFLNDEDTSFKSLTNKHKKQRVLLSNSSMVEYESEPTRTEQSDLQQLAIGRYNDRTGMIELIPIKDVCQIQQSIIGYEMRAKENFDELSYMDRTKMLSTSFGSKLSKKIIHKIETGDVGTLSNEKTKAAAESVTNKRANVDAAARDEDLPPHNKETDVPKEIYPIEELMPQDVYFAINPQYFIGLAKAPEKAPEDMPKYIKNRLPHMLYTYKRNDDDELVAGGDRDQDDIEHESRILTYIYYITIMKGLESSRVTLMEETLRKNRVHPFVAKYLCQTFTQQYDQVKSKMSNDHISKLLNYAVILILHLEDFRVKHEAVQLLSEAFNMPDYKLEKHFNRVGCVVARNGQYRDYKLRAPLKLPEVRDVQRKKR